MKSGSYPRNNCFVILDRPNVNPDMARVTWGQLRFGEVVVNGALPISQIS